ncbi:MAG: metallophosphoesterase [Anaerolineaceae bacterium]|nr:metallophosphoesterase [Anaerolineaceae bacterium]
MKKEYSPWKWAFLFAALVYVVLGLFNPLHIQRYRLADKKIKSPLKIALLADLHNFTHEGKIMALLAKEKPDLVLIAGDLIDDHSPTEAAYALAKELGSLYPVYYVSGNHEVWTHQMEQIKQNLSEYGFHVLEGESAAVSTKGNPIAICGIDDAELKNPEWYAQLDRCAKSTAPQVFDILLTHRPELVKKAYLGKGFELILSGHTHGGQWRLPGLINGLYAPNQGFFPRYAGGLYRFKDSQMVVSRGLVPDFRGLPRFYNWPEVVMLELVPAQD